MSDRIDIAWDTPGPVASAFMASKAEVSIINGPVGSGKTTTALVKAMRLGAAQAPSTRAWARNEAGDRVPVRKIKVCVVRDTYRQLWRSTLPSWFKRVPREAGTFTGAENAPATHRVNFQLRDGSIVDFWVDFVAIGDNAVEDVLRGYEPTLFYLNELDLLSREVLMYARGRYGRYPDLAEGGPSWCGILADCNAPEYESWLHKDIFTKSPDQLKDLAVELFVQPSGLSADAENLNNLPGGRKYYEQQTRGAPDWYVKRMIENRPGYSRAGQPVYADYEDRRHVAPVDLEWLPGMPLLIGVDGGGSPAGVFAQRTHRGVWRVLDELTTEHGTGAVRFGKLLRQRLHDRFPHAATIMAYADPACFYGADRDAEEKNWAELVAATAGIVIRPAPSNDPATRWDAVRRPLTESVDGGPCFQLSPRCTSLRVGFNSGYRFRKRNVSDVRFDERADKNEFSHPHDALQYVMAGGGEYVEIRKRVGRQQQITQSARHEHDWDPFDVSAT